MRIQALENKVEKATQTIHLTSPRIVCYHQTHFYNGQRISFLPLLEKKTAVSHIILAAIHLNEPGNITLNDDPYDIALNDVIWEEVRTVQKAGIKVLGMLGGAALGSFQRLEKDFDLYYKLLRGMVVQTGLDGLDLDVEEEISLASIIRLIDQLRYDFGKDFLITLAPVATALQEGKHLSGFDYPTLEAVFGHNIAWYNTQFYCGWGSVEDTTGYDKIIELGWAADKVVLGVTTNPESALGWVPDEMLQATLLSLTGKYPNFGGVMGWEYFNSITAAEPFGWPWSWANLMTSILLPDFASSPAAEKRSSLVQNPLCSEMTRAIAGSDA